MTIVRDALRRALIPALALLTAFLIGGLLIVLTDVEHLQHLGTDPVGAVGGAIGAMLRGYGAMLAGAIGDPARIGAALQRGDPRDVAAAIRPITETLVSATPLIFVALGVTISFRAGLINLGAESQLFMGGLGATIGAHLVAGALPPLLNLPLALLTGTLAGAAYGFVPGFLKARTGAHEVITTLMLNAIAPSVAFFALSTGDYFGSPAAIAGVPLVFDLPAIRLDYGFFAALAMAAAVSFVLFRTTLGYELRTAGFSPTVARVSGMRPGGSVMLAMTLSGALAGMGGAFLTLGPAGVLSGGPRDVGLVALALALIGGLRPSGVVLMALLYGALINGATSMVIVSGIPLTLLVFIIAVAMLFVAAPGLIQAIWRLPASGRLGSADRPSPSGSGPAGSQSAGT